MVSLSMKLVMSTMFIVVAVITALVAFIPTYRAGIDGMSSALDDLRRTLVGQTVTSIKAYFAGPQKLFEAWDAEIASGLQVFGSHREQTSMAFLCRVLLTNRGVLNTASFWLVGKNDFILCDMRFGLLLGGYMALDPSGQRMRVMVLNQTLHPTNTEFVSFPGPARSIFSPTVIAELSNSSVRRWSSPYAGFNSYQFSAGLTFTDEFGGVGVFLVDVLPKAVVTLLESLDLRGGGRIFVAEERRRVVLGTSWGEETTILLDRYADLAAPENTRMIVKKPSTLNDTLIRAVIEWVGGETAFFALPSPYAATAKDIGGAKGNVYLDVGDITDQWGLRLRFMMALPESDFIGDIVSTRGKTIGGVVGAVAIMLIIAVVFSIVFAQPLVTIGDRMIRTASLEDDDDDESVSLFSEVASIQRAYYTMKKELDRLKSYLPQSVLQRLADEDPEDDEGDITVRSVQSGDAMSKSMESKGPNDGRSASVKDGRRATKVGGGGSDTASHRSAASQHNNKHGAAGAGGARVVASLNTSRTCTVKRIAIAVFNLSGFLSRFTEPAFASKVLNETQVMFLTLVSKHTKDNKGVVDFFCGDHIICTFNAVNNIASTVKRCAQAALAACRDAATVPSLPAVTVGLAAGRALVGNMGDPSVQMRFNVIGGVFQEASQLERLAARRVREAPQPFLVYLPSPMFEEADLEMLLCCREIVESAAGSGGGVVDDRKKRAVAALIAAKNLANDEWLYQLSTSAQNPFTTINEAFLALENDDLEGARRLLAQTLESMPPETTPHVADLSTSVSALQKILLSK